MTGTLKHNKFFGLNLGTHKGKTKQLIKDSIYLKILP